ncbi:MAG TPA: fused MFS/spermidine synthase [Baekduia sp.]|nr:fused MFS/spermidine synthase [Baekduia sp.]
MTAEPTVAKPKSSLFRRVLGEPSTRPPGPRLLALIVFVVGASSLGAEIAAARLLAPWFGASTIIWANTIATVLVGLSVGYWFGGRLADRDPSVASMSKIIFGAAILMALVPFLGSPFLRVSVEALDNIEAGAFVGSLIAVLVLIAVPVVLLGAISPFALRLSVQSVEEAGTVSGRLYAISTLGSLFGVFSSALLLIPVLGTRRTFLVFALALGLVAVAGLRMPRALMLPAAIAGLLALPVGTIKAADGEQVIWEQETAYQYARVVQDGDGDRRLELNEGQAVHSRYSPGEYLTGDYWDEFIVAPLASGAGAPKKVAILGNAAGTTARAIGHYFPQAAIDAVEIDGELTKVGRVLFDMRAPRLRTHTADARPWLRRSHERFDLIMVDAYRQPYIPFYLATREFFAEAREHLTPGGVLAINIGHPEDSPDLEQVLTATVRAEFPYALRDPVVETNTALLASRAPLSATNVAQHVARLPAEIRPLAREFAQRLEAPLRGGRVYTDDVSPVEWLVDASIVKVAAEGER